MPLTTNKVFTLTPALIAYVALLILLPMGTHPDFYRLFMFVVCWIAGGAMFVFGVALLYAGLRFSPSCMYTFIYVAGTVVIAFGIITDSLGLAFLLSPTVYKYSLGSDTSWFQAGIFGVLVWLAVSGMYWLSRTMPRTEWVEAAYAYQPPVTLPPQYGTKLKLGADGELVPVVQSSEDGIMVLHGTGNQVTDVVYLDIGRYQLDYNFDTGQVCEVALVYVDDSTVTNQPILVAGGSGSKTFGAQFSGRYVFEVRCPFVGVRWELCCLLL